MTRGTFQLWTYQSRRSVELQLLFSKKRCVARPPVAFLSINTHESGRRQGTHNSDHLFRRRGVRVLVTQHFSEVVFIQKQPTFRFNKKMRQKKNDVRWSFSFSPGISQVSQLRFRTAVPCSAQGVAGLGANGAMASPKEESWGDAKGALEAMPSCKECQYQLGGENNPPRPRKYTWVLSTRERYTHVYPQIGNLKILVFNRNLFFAGGIHGHSNGSRSLMLKTLWQMAPLEGMKRI